MNTVINLDIVQTIFLSLVQSVGLTKDEIMSERNEDGQYCWFIDQDVSMNSTFNQDLRALVSLVEFFNRSRPSGDDVTACCALMRAGFDALRLSSLFKDICSDVDKVLCRDKRFSWPSLPEGYQIPQHFVTAGAEAMKRLNCLDEATGRDGLVLWKSATREIEVMEKDRIDAIMKTLIEMAEGIGVTREEMAKAKDENDHFEWRIDYNSSLGDRLERYLDQLLLSVEVHRIATHKNDQLAAYHALKDVGAHARSISELFGDIKADAHKVSIFDERFAWPDIPDDYRFPEHLVMSGGC
ncbi:hypothetical protein [Herbaspirillum huttiense]|uniref:Uncharacterized protein n=2 Tax=Herbaspirillum huttiense TaxID=863372 RepID=A0AAJ2LQD4_9BURK|nr:hypothetical protein [Herbaspirillum huttiense]MDR9835622.1 hypothetical protein [Herbaspirillum huttiense]